MGVLSRHLCSKSTQVRQLQTFRTVSSSEYSDKTSMMAAPLGSPRADENDVGEVIHKLTLIPAGKVLSRVIISFQFLAKLDSYIQGLFF